MSVYIKGMEMPENCYRCLFFRMTNEWDKNDEADILFRCARTGEETWDYNGGYLPNCPLIHVPDHGRLGDLDKLESGLRLMAKYQEGERQQGILSCCETIRLTPTIIEADKEEQNG